MRRTQYDLRKAEERAHILGPADAIDNLDEATSPPDPGQRDPDVARRASIERFGLQRSAGPAILDMCLQRLTGLERDKIRGSMPSS